MQSSLKRLFLAALFCAAVSLSWADSSQTIPQRVVTFAPNITQWAFALGAGDRVVGISDFCIYPPEALTRRKCGGEISPNFELLVALKPDLIIVEGKAAKIREFCNNNHIAFLGLEMNSLEQIKSDVTTLGRVLGVAEKAKTLIDKMDADLNRLRVDVTKGKRPRVFISLFHPQGSMGTLATAGGGTFLDEMIVLAGGENIFADRAEPYPRVSKETLIRRRPEIILEFLPGEKIDARRNAEMDNDWASLSSIPAVKQKRIRRLTEDYVLMPGTRIVQIARLLRAAVHPELKEIP